MPKLGPVTVTTPRFFSGDLALGAVAGTGGMLFTDYITSSMIVRTGWTGTNAIAAGALAKLGLGGLMYYGATKTEGLPEKALYVGFFGSLASIGLDLYHWYRPAPTESATVRAARLRRAPPARLAPASRAVAPAKAGVSLGGRFQVT